MDPHGIPRYAPPEPEPEEGPTCSDCICCKDVERDRYDPPTYTAACVYEIYQAKTPDELERAEIVYVDPTGEPCADFKGDRWYSR